LNDKDVPIAADGTFAFTLELGEGPATYWLMARTAEGYGTYFKMNVSVSKDTNSASATVQQEQATGTGHHEK
jgi:hypothetical protein